MQPSLADLHDKASPSSYALNLILFVKKFLH